MENDFRPDDLGAFRGLAEALLLLKVKSKRSVTEIARRTKISRSAVHRYLNGDTDPRLRNLGLLLEHGLGMDYLDLAEALAEVNTGPVNEDLLRAVRLLQLRLRTRLSDRDEQGNDSRDNP